MTARSDRRAGSVYTRRSDSTRRRERPRAARRDPARERDADVSTPMRLATSRGGGFRIELGGGVAPIIADPAGEGWEVRQGPEGLRWLLHPESAFPGGFILRESGGGESGRTTREADREGPPSNLLAPDGRLFLIRRRGPGVARFELSGWEVPGAYLVARPDEGAFEIERTEAGRELDVAAEVLILFAAEIVQAIASDARD
jgi:hypothetical protein